MGEGRRGRGRERRAILARRDIVGDGWGGGWLVVGFSMREGELYARYVMEEHE